VLRACVRAQSAAARVHAAVTRLHKWFAALVEVSRMLTRRRDVLLVRPRALAPPHFLDAPEPRFLMPPDPLSECTRTNFLVRNSPGGWRISGNPDPPLDQAPRARPRAPAHAPAAARQAGADAQPPAEVLNSQLRKRLQRLGACLPAGAYLPLGRCGPLRRPHRPAGFRTV
jgi:hypothetical protein